MVVLYSQEFGYLCTYGNTTCRIEHYFSWFVNFGHHLLGVDKYATIWNKVELVLEKVDVGHGALKIINVKYCRAKDVAQCHKCTFIDAVEIILLVEVICLHNCDACSGLLIEYRNSDSVPQILNA